MCGIFEARSRRIPTLSSTDSTYTANGFPNDWRWKLKWGETIQPTSSVGIAHHEPVRNAWKRSSLVGCGATAEKRSDRIRIHCGPTTGHKLHNCGRSQGTRHAPQDTRAGVARSRNKLPQKIPRPTQNGFKSGHTSQMSLPEPRLANEKRVATVPCTNQSRAMIIHQSKHSKPHAERTLPSPPRSFLVHPPLMARNLRISFRGGEFSFLSPGYFLFLSAV